MPKYRVTELLALLVQIFCLVQLMNSECTFLSASCQSRIYISSRNIWWGREILYHPRMLPRLVSLHHPSDSLKTQLTNYTSIKPDKWYFWETARRINTNREKSNIVPLPTHHDLWWKICLWNKICGVVLGSSSNNTEVINWSWEK